MTTQDFTDVRPSPIAGRRWYPGDPEQLAASVDRMLNDAPVIDIPGRIVGIIVPHAGHAYSGHIAAYAFKLLRGMEIERVVVVSPLHQFYFAPILTTAHQAYQTPLGNIPVDRATLDALGRYVAITPVRRDSEHSLEIELPFLQRVFDRPFLLVPLMLLDQSYPTALSLGKALAAVIGSDEKTLLVASSDLSHRYPEERAHRLDRIMLDRFEAFDPEGVIRVEEEGHAFACGRAAVATVLVAARELGADQCRVIRYGTSAETTGERDEVVGYGAAVIFRTGERKE